MAKAFELISIRRNKYGFYIATLYNLHDDFYINTAAYGNYPLKDVYRLLRRDWDCIVSRAAIKKGVQYDTI